MFWWTTQLMILISLRVTVSSKYWCQRTFYQFSNILDEELDAELTTFRKTMYEEVFSKKVGVNPPLLLHPEEIPIIAELDNDKEHDNHKPVDQPREPLHARKTSSGTITNSNIDSDDEVQPANYLFSSECWHQHNFEFFHHVMNIFTNKSFFL